MAGTNEQQAITAATESAEWAASKEHLKVEFERIVLAGDAAVASFTVGSNQRWIVPLDATARVEISDTDAARAMFIRDLTGDLGVNDEGVAVVLHLVDQLHGLRRALTELRIEMNASRGDPGREAE